MSVLTSIHTSFSEETLPHSNPFDVDSSDCDLLTDPLTLHKAANVSFSRLQLQYSQSRSISCELCRPNLLATCDIWPLVRRLPLRAYTPSVYALMYTIHIQLGRLLSHSVAVIPHLSPSKDTRSTTALTREVDRRAWRRSYHIAILRLCGVLDRCRRKGPPQPVDVAYTDGSFWLSRARIPLRARVSRVRGDNIACSPPLSSSVSYLSVGLYLLRCNQTRLIRVPRPCIHPLMAGRGSTSPPPGADLRLTEYSSAKYRYSQWRHS